MPLYPGKPQIYWHKVAWCSHGYRHWNCYSVQQNYLRCCCLLWNARHQFLTGKTKICIKWASLICEFSDHSLESFHIYCCAQLHVPVYELKMIFISVYCCRDVWIQTGCPSSVVSWLLALTAVSTPFQLFNYSVLICCTFTQGHDVLPSERKSEMGTKAPADQIKQVEKLNGVCFGKQIY